MTEQKATKTVPLTTLTGALAEAAIKAAGAGDYGGAAELSLAIVELLKEQRARHGG